MAPTTRNASAPKVEKTADEKFLGLLEVEVYPPRFDGVLADVTLKVGPLLCRNFVLREGQNGYWLAAPAKKAGTGYFNITMILGRDMNDHIAKIAFDKVNAGQWNN